MSLKPSLAVPAVETERLLFAGHQLADFPDIVRLWADPVVTRFIGGKPCTEEQTWARFLRYAGLWTHLGFGYWVVREKASGRFVGEVGFADFRRDMTPPMGDAPEAGWVLAPWSHGKGFATEAVRAALAWRDGEIHAGRTRCIIGPENLASIRVAEKCGFREIARCVYMGPVVLFER